MSLMIPDDQLGPGRSEAACRELGRYLRELRADTPQRALAKRVGVTAPFLSRIEHGHIWPSEKLLKKLAKELGEDPQKLLKRAALLRAVRDDEAGRILIEQLSRGLGAVEDEEEGRWDHLRGPLPSIVEEVTGREKLAETMISMLPDPDQGPAPSDSSATIVFCRYSDWEPLRVEAAALRAWGRRLQFALQNGFDFDHFRSQGAWAAEVWGLDDRRSEAEWGRTSELGGPISLLNRLLGFKGEYRPYSIPDPVEPSTRLAYLDVPGRGALLFDSDGSGCYIPHLPELKPLTDLLRKEALALVKGRALVTRHTMQRPGSLDRGLQQALLKIESEPGDQILVKAGLSVVLQPPAVWSAMLERLCDPRRSGPGRITPEERTDLEAEHKARREHFRKNLLRSKFLDICPEHALVNFANTGRFQDDAPDEPEALMPSERGEVLEHVATIIDETPNYELVLVKSLPFAMRCYIKDSRDPVVCIETPRTDPATGTPPPWVTIKEQTFAKAIGTQLRRSHPQDADERNRVIQRLRDLAEVARSQPSPVLRPG